MIKASEKASKILIRDFGEIENLQVSKKGPSDFVTNSDLKAEIITPIFKEIRLGKPKIISFFAKKARGMMARYIVQNQINKKDQILNFNLDGYKYNPELSSNEYEPVFTREKN